MAEPNVLASLLWKKLSSLQVLELVTKAAKASKKTVQKQQSYPDVFLMGGIQYLPLKVPVTLLAKICQLAANLVMELFAIHTYIHVNTCMHTFNGFIYDIKSLTIKYWHAVNT